MKKLVGLSKSKIMRGLQCEKSLYLEVYNKDLAAPISKSQQAIFDQGHEVGFAAQKLFPGGVLIDSEYWDTTGAVQKTLAAVKKGAVTLFEATVAFENVSARADIFKQVAKKKWEIIEVKSTTTVKEEHLDDCAVQYWVFKNSGYQIEKISVMHINNQYEYPARDGLFKLVDVTKEVEERLAKIPKLVKKLTKVLENEKAPEIDIGPHCTSPYECPFIEHCWKKIPVPSVFDIPRIGQKAWKYFERGQVEVGKIDDSALNAKQARALQVLKTGKRFVDPKNISEQLRLWQWPIYFLDFETINTAIPIYDGTHPFQQIPFQFSCHVLESLESDPRHFEYLHQDLSDPREPLAKALAVGFGDTGSVVAYNKKFEAGVLKSLSQLLPKYKKKLLSISDRLVDPHPVIESSVYDKGFLGSLSLKSVAPALLGESLSYKGLEIGDGSSASQAYLTLMKGQLAGPEKGKLIKAMLDYCRQDTLATVELVKWLMLQN